MYAFFSRHFIFIEFHYSHVRPKQVRDQITSLSFQKHYSRPNHWNPQLSGALTADLSKLGVEGERELHLYIFRNKPTTWEGGGTTIPMTQLGLGSTAQYFYIYSCGAIFLLVQNPMDYNRHCDMIQCWWVLVSEVFKCIWAKVHMCNDYMSTKQKCHVFIIYTQIK